MDEFFNLVFVPTFFLFFSFFKIIWVQIDKEFMAPTRKPRSMNKRFSSLNEVSPEKEGVSSNKNKQRVRFV